MCVCLQLPGPTNKKLRVHLPILAPGKGLSRLRVGSETREAVAGRALVFDDSFEHEAWNDSDTLDSSAKDAGLDTENDTEALSSGGASRRIEKSRRERRPAETGEGRDWSLGEGIQAEGGPSPRVTLIADVWHPDLSKR